MLMITSFANPRVAQAFVDYMATQGVILTIQQHTRATSGWPMRVRPGGAG
jgi:GlpG protein